MDGAVEIISGRERRRRWSVADKLRIVAEVEEPGAMVRSVAARNGICESLLFTWRRQVRAGALRRAEMPAFMPVMLDRLPATSPVVAPERPVKASSTRSWRSMIEIELGDGRQIRVGGDVGVAALRRVLAALRG